uniref:(California timema) hypothetical protein n=1 Tax=Timema californicum TaxID=61474 RepID=A0A7R9PCF3_TIMCA|nr:unnamed protein product [Timema californicum]
MDIGSCPCTTMGSNQQFSLRWNNYLRHITNAFDSLRSDEDLVDVTLSCEGKRIRAHKMLLSACSTYFRDLFKVSCETFNDPDSTVHPDSRGRGVDVILLFQENPCQHPVIIFRSVKFEDLSALIDFMYQGEVNVLQDQLASFLTTAELLAVQGLSDGRDASGPAGDDDDEIKEVGWFTNVGSFILSSWFEGVTMTRAALFCRLRFQTLRGLLQNPKSRSLNRRRKRYLPVLVLAMFECPPHRLSSTPTKSPLPHTLTKNLLHKLSRPRLLLRSLRHILPPPSDANGAQRKPPLLQLPGIWPPVLTPLRLYLSCQTSVLPNLKVEAPDYCELGDDDGSYGDSNSGPGGGPDPMAQLLDSKQDFSELYSTNSRDSSLTQSESFLASDLSQLLSKPGPSGENQSQDSLQGEYSCGSVVVTTPSRVLPYMHSRTCLVSSERSSSCVTNQSGKVEERWIETYKRDEHNMAVTVKRKTVYTAATGQSLEQSLYFAISTWNNIQYFAISTWNNIQYFAISPLNNIQYFAISPLNNIQYFAISPWNDPIAVPFEVHGVAMFVITSKVCRITHSRFSSLSKLVNVILRPLARSSAAPKLVLWNDGRGVAPQPTNVSFRVNKNR